MMETDSAGWRRFLIGHSAPLLEICDIIHLIASKRCTVLISGETGTGKEVIARAIHAASDRAAFPMVSVNCTALPANLIETELFGHAKGAFTGAQSSRAGRFEQAHRGTMFLDEIGDLPLDAQAKLLRVLQEREVQRVGSSETVRVDVRIVAASNIDLEAAVRERKFREDLYYRLNVVPIHMPPLRERRGDVALLAGHFLTKIAESEKSPRKDIAADALNYLEALDWPGNVRQLEHAVQKAVALSGDRELLTREDFVTRRANSVVSDPEPKPLMKVGKEGLNFDAVVTDFERSLINQALALTNGNKSHAADLLGIKRTTLLAKLKTFEEPAFALAC
jgi:transcriptional regulator with GAF, ATPase, and Fis domain